MAVPEEGFGILEQIAEVCDLVFFQKTKVIFCKAAHKECATDDILDLSGFISYSTVWFHAQQFTLFITD